jgi:DNA-directed RNA polymerase sigma subunit (sigma70/sigma32)
LDVVDREPDGVGRVTVARLLGLTRERVRQIEEAAAAKLRALVERE